MLTFDQYMSQNGRQAELDRIRDIPGGYEKAKEFYDKNGYYGTNESVLSQRDPRWAGKKLGFSDLTIGSYGCTLTSLTMLLNRLFGYNLTPDVVNDKLKLAKAFSGALIWWARVPLAYPQLKWIRRDYNYSNILVAWYIYVLRLPVLVEVNGASIGPNRHWVLYIGNRQCVDPWTGKVVSTSTYPAIGDALFQRA